MTWATLVTALALAALVGASCAGSDDGATPTPTPPSPKTAVVALADEPAGFNANHPRHAGAAASDVAGLVWPSAYRIRPDYRPEPWLLSAPATVVSSEPFVVEWRIRPDADWSDGTPVSSDDFEYLYRRCAGLVEGETCTDGAGYEQVTAFEALDAKTVRATFDPPFAEFESLFRDIAPSHVAEGRPSGWNSAFADDPGPSAGPFRFVAWTPGESMVFERNDRYFGEAPEVERLTVRFLDAAGQIEALRNGEVDVAFPEVGADTFEALSDASGIGVQVGESREVEVLVFNLEHDLLSLAPVRRAIALAVDRTSLVESLVESVDRDAPRLASHVLVPDQAGYEAHGGEFSDASVDLARAELEAAGFERSEDGFYGLDGVPLDLRISTTTGVVRREREVQQIEAALREVGVKVTIDNSPPDVLDERIASGDFDIASTASAASGFPAVRARARFVTGGSRNDSRFSEPGADELIATAVESVDAAIRRAALNDLDRLLWEFMPELPLYQPAAVLAYDAALSGLAFNPTSEGHLWNIETWDRPPPAGL